MVVCEQWTQKLPLYEHIYGKWQKSAVSQVLIWLCWILIDENDHQGPCAWRVLTYIAITYSEMVNKFISHDSQWLSICRIRTQIIMELRWGFSWGVQFRDEDWKCFLKYHSGNSEVSNLFGALFECVGAQWVVHMKKELICIRRSWNIKVK